MSITTTELIKGIPDWNQTINENNTILANAIDENTNKIGDLNTSVENVNTQLSDMDNNKVDKVTGKELSTNDYDDTEKAKVALITNKADITYVDTKTQANNLSYKESYDTLVLLQTAYPNGDIYNHCVLADGYIYTWVNSAWTSTKVSANGTGIADKTVTPEKVTFLDKLSNIFNKNDTGIVRGYYANANTDATNTDSFYSYPLEVQGGDIVRWKKYALYGGTNKHGGRVLKADKSYWYNLSGSSITEYDTYFETTIGGTGTIYIQLNGLISDIDNFIAVKNENYLSEYVPYGNKLGENLYLRDNIITENSINSNVISTDKIKPNAVTTDKINDKSITKIKTTFLTKLANVFDKNDTGVVKGYFATANTDYPNSDSFYTAPIEINPGDIVRWKKYSLYVNGTNLYGGRVLTPSKVYAYNLSQSSITDKGTYFEFTYAGTDTRYAQFNGIISDIDNFIVVKNISYPASYISYGYAMDKDININDNSIETKNIKDKAVSYEKLSDSAITTIKNLNKSFLSYLNLNALCIGDSLTQGAYYDTIHNGQSINENYPYYLSKLSKWNVTNGGASGYTTQQWYDIKALNYNFANFDTFIICLGTNGGLTDTIDTDCVGTDYNNYADTNTGCYCKLIEKILAQNPNAKIYMTNVFASSGDLALTNAVLKKIAIKYNLPFINIYDGTLNGKALYHPFGNTVHFGKVGNLFFAKQIFDQITEYINNNLANYETLLL